MNVVPAEKLTVYFLSDCQMKIKKLWGVQLTKVSCEQVTHLAFVRVEFIENSRGGAEKGCFFVDLIVELKLVIETLIKIMSF